MTKKVTHNGNVAIAVSPGFGAGWSTWNKEVSPFDPKVIQMIREGRQREIDEAWCEEQLGIDGVFCGGVRDLEIRWLPEGTRFYIHEYDGSESIKTLEDLIFTA